jgi:hypothetical protein
MKSASIFQPVVSKYKNNPFGNQLKMPEKEDGPWWPALPCMLPETRILYQGSAR